MLENLNDLPDLGLLVGEDGDDVVVLNSLAVEVARYRWVDGSLQMRFVKTDLLAEHLLGAVLASGESL